MIEAQFSSKCPGCGEQITEGDDIGMVDEEWVCQGCVDDAGGEDVATGQEYFPQEYP